jgi:hypothetical protein
MNKMCHVSACRVHETLDTHDVIFDSDNKSLVADS